LVTEKEGRLRIIRNGVLDPKPIPGAPSVRAQGRSGLMDVVLHPQFASNRLVYFSYLKPVGTERQSALTVRSRPLRWNRHHRAERHLQRRARRQWAIAPRLRARRQALYDDAERRQRQQFAGSQQLLGQRSFASTTMGRAGGQPVRRTRGHKPEIYTLGHRNSLGLAVHPATGELWQNEMGPNGGDEINILKPGANYGWPLVSLGRTYTGPWQSPVFSKEGFESPVVYWMPSISLSGLTFYTGSKLPKWKGDIFVGGQRTGEIPGTGHLERILVNEKLEELRRESLLVPLGMRIRDVRQGPDELLYVIVDHDQNGGILRIEPRRYNRSPRRIRRGRRAETRWACTGATSFI
jgi:glucose/arabinose dehydrogenase